MNKQKQTYLGLPRHIGLSTKVTTSCSERLTLTKNFIVFNTDQTTKHFSLAFQTTQIICHFCHPSRTE